MTGYGARAGHLAAILAAVLGVLLSLAGPAAAAGLTVLQNPTDVRSGPGLTYAVESEARRGAVYPVTGTQDGWYRVDLGHGTTGWLAGRAVTTAAGPGTALTVTWPDVALYAGPGTGYPVVDWVGKGTSLTVWEKEGGWIQVAAPDGAAGWLPAALAASSPGAPRSLPPALAVTADSLDVRGGPGTGDRPLTWVTKGDLLIPRGRFGNWYEVFTPADVLGWVYGKYTRPADLPPVGGDLLAGVVQNGVDLFAGPGTGFPVVARMEHGGCLEIVGEQGTWLEVKLGSGQEGWVPAAVVAQDREKADTPEGTSVIDGKGVWYEPDDRITSASDFDGASLVKAGVTHIYVEAGTTADGFPTAWQKQLNIVLPAAHRLGIKVILWVYVKLRNVAADAALTGQVANYVTPDGQRPDAVAADIEELGLSHQADRELVAGYATLTRRLLPRGMPLIAVTYPPQFEGDYPFAFMADDFNALALMDYWHTTVNDYGREGAAGLVRNSLVLTRAKAGRDIPVEVILQGFNGGAGWPDRREMLAALGAARAAQGYSVYTWRSMNGILRQAFTSFK